MSEPASKPDWASRPRIMSARRSSMSMRIIRSPARRDPARGEWPGGAPRAAGGAGGGAPGVDGDALEHVGGGRPLAREAVPGAREVARGYALGGGKGDEARRGRG